MNNDELIALALLGVGLLYFLRGSAAGPVQVLAGPVEVLAPTAGPAQVAIDGDCPGYGGDLAAAAAAAPGVAPVTPASSAVPSWYTEKLTAFTSGLEASNAAGTWESSWRIAAERDAWIAGLGILPTQWEAYV